MSDYPDSAMIALIPTVTDWCQIDLPHVTLVYAGEIAAMGQAQHNELCKATMSLAMANSSIALKVMGVDVFGDEEKVDVLRLEPTPQILAMRAAVESWNASQYVDYKPHATVGPEGSSATVEIPYYLEFDQIMCCWGDQRTSYWFRPVTRRVIDAANSLI